MTIKTILVTGSNGLLGQKLTQLYVGKSDRKLIATGMGANRNPLRDGYVYISMDVTKPENIMAVLNEHKPDAIIHCAAMTQVDDCETAPEKCHIQNVEAVKHLVHAANNHAIPLYHVSTDFIFDGKKGDYHEEDAPHPLSIYGQSKWEAELYITAHCKAFAILRTVLVYGVVEDMSRSNIVLWARQALSKGGEIKVVNDQWRTPTLAEDLAMGCFLAESNNARGIYNVAGPDKWRIDDLVKEVAKTWNLSVDLVQTISSETLKQAAKRPPHTGLIIDKAVREWGYAPRDLQAGLLLVRQQLEALGR